MPNVLPTKNATHTVYGTANTDVDTLLITSCTDQL